VQSIDVKALMRDVTTSAQISTGRPRLPIPISGDDVRASADPEMLRAALLNIMLNACQAAGKEEVEVHIAADSGRCRIAIRDRGPGIPAEVRDRVFEPFFTTRPNGTGLGLAIVKRMVELQEGTVTLHDRPDGGTIAEVTVPRASAQDRSRALQRRSWGQGSPAA
jgi:signal transduction histidine kinase